MLREPLDKTEVVKTIERRGAGRVPLLLHKWWGKGLWEKYGTALDRLGSAYPDDIFMAWYTCPGDDRSPNGNPSYRWGFKDDYSDAKKHSIGETVELLNDWSEIDLFMDDFPDPYEPDTFEPVESRLKEAGKRYRLGCWWSLFHERLWGIRGMENLMIDYYENMEGLKQVGRKLLEYYKVVVDRYATLGFDGIFTSDDLGHQRGPMMSPDTFRELYLPLYEEFCSYVHGKGMHVFLHSCGDNTRLMEYLIQAGIDVLHPIQKGCMDETFTAAEFGNRISFLAGVDVQDLLPNGSVQDVKNGVRKLIDIYYKNDGGLLLAAGNGILPDTPIENIKAMLDEMTLYK